MREHNEDAFLIHKDLGLFVVCDGVGGRARGEVASQETAELILDWVLGDSADVAAGQHQVPDDAALLRLTNLVRGAIQNACYMVHTMGQLDPTHQGMSTTASMLLIVEGYAIVGWVGDSRVYVAHADKISQVSEDHTLVNYQVKHGVMTAEQARQSRMKHVITRAVGHRDSVEVDVVTVPLAPGDKLLLCSDGLHEYLEGRSTLAELFVLDVRTAAREAIRHANESGGCDNITALFIEYLGAVRPTSQPNRPSG